MWNRVRAAVAAAGMAGALAGTAEAKVMNLTITAETEYEAWLQVSLDNGDDIPLIPAGSGAGTLLFSFTYDTASFRGTASFTRSVDDYVIREGSEFEGVVRGTPSLSFNGTRLDEGRLPGSLALRASRGVRDELFVSGAPDYFVWDRFFTSMSHGDEEMYLGFGFVFDLFGSVAVEEGLGHPVRYDTPFFWTSPGVGATAFIEYARELAWIPGGVVWYYLNTLGQNGPMTIELSEVVPVPLPPSALLLLGGIGGISALRRSRRMA